MIPKKFEPLLFSLILSGMMSLLVSGVTTWRVGGLHPAFLQQWLQAWLTAWTLAFPAVTVLAPATRRLVALLVAKDGPAR
ncbi:DUF2798 domain-containing protein [Massilia sp. TS11]|uniref:DUF2798 domain-containing protein n=1 Tax=Massilia sp. TS11 TaxID=2908003 RepID=UPI001EDC62CE|nr:DUF2798 domain-containing protein [Massilia sp. TS11]MCG2583834.1 DUF2798 domain-containing protein [Massilia sp. TS11]